jgi:hypothetical protein
LKTSVVALAKIRLDINAITVKTARAVSPIKTQATNSAELINSVISKGMPSMPDMIDARVCSFHEMGNQYMGCTEAFAPMRCT